MRNAKQIAVFFRKAMKKNKKQHRDTVGAISPKLGLENMTPPGELGEHESLPWRTKFGEHDSHPLETTEQTPANLACQTTGVWLLDWTSHNHGFSWELEPLNAQVKKPSFQRVNKQYRSIINVANQLAAEPLLVLTPIKYPRSIR